MVHDTPDLPDGWVVSTNIEQHVAFLFDDGRSIAVKPFSDSAWKVIGVADYAPEAPVFVQNVTIKEAMETAAEVMEAVTNGTEGDIEPVKTIGAAFDPEGEDADTGEDAADSAEETASGDSQADLSSFLELT